MFGLSNLTSYAMIGMGIALVLTIGGSYLYYRDSQKTIATLNSNNGKLQTAVDTQRGFITYLQSENQRQNEAVIELNKTQVANQIEKDNLLAILRKHNLEQLAREKPKLLENQINNATRNRLQEIENETQIKK